MAIRNIVTKGDDVLRKICRTQMQFDDKLAMILDDMRETMYKAEGVGLAAPQVGLLRRFCIIDVGDGLIELINPVIMETRGSQIGPEGCLSVPGESAEVERPMYVKVRAQDRFGNNIVVEGTELKARALCHEIDHLDGILYIDKVKR
ncbi:MAG: peptide deformylase [Clostridia bacterium]|nr:peptide deformylase [Oscillospiraceae bacterium]MBO5358918.1 peptide deformylase [Clostridia bacterium]